MLRSASTLDYSVVVFQTQVRDQTFAHQMAESILQLHELDEQIVLGIELGRGHGRIKIEAQPFLNSNSLQLGAALCQVEEQHQIKHDGRGENGVAAEKVHFNLHGIAKPAEDIYVVPTLFVITTRRIVVNPYLVVKILVQIRIELGLQDLLQNRKLGLFFGLEGSWVVQNFAIAVAQNVGGEPPAQPQHASLESRGEHRLHQRLAGLVILAANWGMVTARELAHDRQIHREVGSSVGERHPFRERGIG